MSRDKGHTVIEGPASPAPAGDGKPPAAPGIALDLIKIKAIAGAHDRRCETTTDPIRPAYSLTAMAVRAGCAWKRARLP